jgi:hypothetical protein
MNRFTTRLKLAGQLSKKLTQNSQSDAVGNAFYTMVVVRALASKSVSC